jgi:hypothetical protein
MGKRGDKRRKREHERRRAKRIPYEGFQFGPFIVERMGRFMYWSVDPTFADDAFREAQQDARRAWPEQLKQLRSELKSTLAEHDAFDVIANLWLLNVPKDPETYREWEDDGILAAVELAASVLVERPSRAGSGPRRPISADLMLRVQEQLKSLLMLIAFVAMDSATSGGTEPGPIEEIQARAKAFRVGVRGPSYEWQERQTIEDLFDGTTVRADVVAATGLSAQSCLTLVDAGSTIGLTRLRARAVEARAMTATLIADIDRVRRGLEPVDPRSREIAENIGDQDSDEAAFRLHNVAISWVAYGLGDTMSFTAEELATAASCDTGTAERFLSMFSVGLGELDLGERDVSMEDIRDRPLLHDAEGRYISVSIHNLLWSVRPRLELALKQAGTTVFRRYERHRARTIERRAIEAISHAVQPDWAHASLQYEVDDQGEQKRLELDGLVRADSALFIIEAKASSMRASARRVAPISFQEWLKDEVSAAAQQARRARRALLESNATIFDARGRALELDLEGIEHVLEVVVVLEDLPAVSPSSWLLADAGVLPTSPIPRVVSLHELEIMCDVVERPSEFVHYLLRRSRMDDMRRAWAMDELDYFMHYLKFGLFWPAVPDDQPTPPPENLLSHTDELDAWYMYRRGERQAPAAKPTAKHHPKVAALLDCLGSVVVPGRLNAALAILNIDGKPRRKVVELLTQLRRRSQLDGKKHDASLVFTQEDISGVTVVSCPPRDAQGLPDELVRYCTLKKYQMHAESWVGFGCWAGPHEPVQCVFVLTGRWEHDEDLERIVAGLPSAGTDGNFDGRSEARRRRAKAQSRSQQESS